MAEVNVKQTQKPSQKPQGSGQAGAQSGQESRAVYPSAQSGGLGRRSAFPSWFSLSPRELFTASPFELMRRFTEEMDRAFEGVGSWRGDRELTAWSPNVEVSERQGKLEVCADLPGLKKDDVSVEVTDQNLVIQGERKQEAEREEAGLYRSERSYGRFYRSIPLPEGADIERARAEFSDGVLKVSIPLPETQRRSRQIPIEAGGPSRQGGQQEAA